MHDGFDPTLYAILDLTPDGPMIGIDRACHAVTGGVTVSYTHLTLPTNREV